MTKTLNVFVDTNIIVGAWHENKHKEDECLQYLYKLKNLHKKQIFISSLTFAQLSSMFQKKLGDKELRKRLQILLSKFTILAFSPEDIEKAMRLEETDIEDNIQYIIGRKAKCTYFVTRNKRDFAKYANIFVVSPERINTIDF
ncbi:MAG: PIN domain-containing protein [Prevotellaceae bacterium]|jgi:predicted nucleic acid-binding protein|nr:PIN domain-containing protein [Prevotellaceae bacterium]GHT35105.1 hypothetical protein FACS189434_12400 [Bacteroidia bacterium]